jgi:hypothetical protein
VSAVALAIASGFALAPADAQETSPLATDLGLRGDIKPLDQISTGATQSPTQPSLAPDTDIDDDTNNGAGTTDAGTANGAAVNPNAFPGSANYGLPKPPNDPTKRYAGQPSKPTAFKNPLPALVPYPSSATSAERKKAGIPADEDDPAPTTATLPPIPRKTPPKVDADPYAPVGIDVGSLRLVPYAEVDGGYDSNPSQQPGGHGSPLLRGETGFAVQSDWSVHQLTGELHAGYTDYTKQRKASSPDGSTKFDLRLDATRNTAIDLEARGTLATQSAGSPILGSTQVSERPLVATYGGTAGVTQTLGDASLGLHGTIDRTVYSDATEPDGTILDLSADSYTAYGLKTRFGYTLTPGVIPFAEIDVDTRQHDQTIDSSGFNRNSNGQAGMIGTTFELTRLLTGEIDGGYAEREYADPRLSNLHGPTYDVSLAWAVTPLTTITLKGNTTLSETTVAGSPGAITRTISLELAHQLFYNVKLDAQGSYGTNTYQGVNLFEQNYMGSFTAEYDLSRFLALKASVSTQHFVSTAANANYTENKFMLGLKVQR